VIHDGVAEALYGGVRKVLEALPREARWPSPVGP
jgi:hypothetical protein